MSYDNIIFESTDNIGVIKFNRPKVLNAINSELLSEFENVLEMIAVDQDIKVLILTGEGEKAFVAGADIGAMKNFIPLEAKKFSQNGQKVFSLLETLPIPVIACVNGYALGGGTEIAMACDFIYASENAKFGQPEITMSLIPGFGGTQRLSRLVGQSRALELCLTGELIPAKEALTIGLVNRVFPHDQLWEETIKTAKSMAQKGRIAIRAIKTIIRNGIDRDIEVGCVMESDGFALCFSGNDAKEGINAFLEKRKPDFKDRL
ncbi:MAG: enoyl-CoA hydratase/isomerase family protein [Deltaproteobacteria bacterium]|nr:enoyl-CoA hydratase/isomerase family protein [Deltaproteobacteria bacterium]